MRYFGGKQRIAKKLSQILSPIITMHSAYVEPFVGGGSVMAMVRAPSRIGSDANLALINMWSALSSGWHPPDDISEETYALIKSKNDPNDPMTAFVGFGVSFAGKWFGGYARGGVDRNYAANAASSLRKKMKGLAGVKWVSSDYRDMIIPDDSVIYCDPPYQGTTQYGAVGNFSSGEFWAWCLEKHMQGQAVLVSEYKAPPEFETYAIIPTKTDIRTSAHGKESRMECLFIPKGASYG